MSHVKVVKRLENLGRSWSLVFSVSASICVVSVCRKACIYIYTLRIISIMYTQNNQLCISCHIKCCYHSSGEELIPGKVFTERFREKGEKRTQYSGINSKTQEDVSECVERSGRRWTNDSLADFLA